MAAAPFKFALEQYPLASATLYGVGGPARLALLPTTVGEAAAAHAWMLAQDGPRLILGAGSNVLIEDAGFPGIVLITTQMTGYAPLGRGRVEALGGTALDVFLREVMVPANYEGVGALTGIPGSVGGAIYMNAGTVNGSTCELLESVALSRGGKAEQVEMDASQYGYRGQTFCGENDLILSAVFRFVRAREDQAPLYERYMARRRERQPQGACCGSVFKNPEDDHAGRLIEACGLKGMRRGGAVISEQHANFIMNDDGATFDDIVWLIRLCQQRVKDQIGVELAEEVRIIGSAS